MPDEAPKRLIVVGDRVLIAPEEGEERTNVGLYLPPTAVEARQVQDGRVVATGPGTPMTEPASMDDEPWKIRGPEVKYLPMQARMGDYALFFRKAAVEITFEGSKYLVVRRSQPKTWSVVRLTPAQGADETHRMYLVCPGCHTRQHLTGRPKESECPKCRKTYPVDWSDRA